MGALVEDGRTVTQRAIGAAFERWDEPGRVSYAAPDQPLEQSAGWERVHALSEVISSLLGVGLEIELVHEFDATPAPTPWLHRGDDGLYRFPDDLPAFPVSYSIRARRRLLT